MQNSLFAALALSSALVFPSLALAASNLEGAQTFANSFLTRQKESLQSQGLTVVETGTIQITEQGKFFAVTYPALTITGGKDAPKMDIGSMRMNLMPGDQDKEWKMTLAIPSPIKFSGPKGAVDLTIGTQKFSAVINEETLFPRMLDAQYQNIKFLSPAGDIGINLGDMALKMNYTADPSGLWSGPFTMVMGQLSLDAKEKDGSSGHIKIGEIGLDGHVTKLDAEKIRSYNKKMSELMNAGLDPDKVESAESMNALWNIIMEDGMQQMDGIKANFTIKDIDMNLPQGDKPGAAPIAFKLGQLGYNFEADGMRGDKSNGAFGINAKGITAPTGQDPALTKYVPQDVTVTFGYKNLPHKALMQQLGTLAAAGASTNVDCAALPDQKDCAAKQVQQGQMVAMQAMMQVPALFAQAGTIFTINNTEIRATDYNVNMNGEFKAAQGAIYGGTGTLKTVFAGLDQIVTDMQGQMKASTTTPELSAKLGQAMQGLIMLQMMGGQGQDASGKPARIYDLAVDEKGSVKLNGADLSALMPPKAEAEAGTPASPGQ